MSLLFTRRTGICLWQKLVKLYASSSSFLLFSLNAYAHWRSSTFTFMHLADAFIQSDLQCIQVIHFFCQYMCSLGIEPTTFVLLLKQCSNHWATGTAISHLHIFQVPFTTMLALLCMWFGISMPLVYLGYYFGFRKPPYDNPVRTNQIPRQVPEQRWYMNKFVGYVALFV